MALVLELGPLDDPQGPSRRSEAGDALLEHFRKSSHECPLFLLVQIAIEAPNGELVLLQV